MEKQSQGKMSAPGEELIAGRNAVAEALRSGRALDSVLVTRGEHNGTLNGLISQCRRRGYR